MNDNILNVENLSIHFPIRLGGMFTGEYRALKAVDDVSFELKKGETLGIVGESGCGKSTLARGILQLLKPTSGRVVWQGKDLVTLNETEVRPYRQDLQIIFQDPLASLNPRMTIGDIIAEPLITFETSMSKDSVKNKVKEMMSTVGLSPEMINRYPHEFSGGQCQRIGVARAMILEPDLIVCDEPVSALDVSIQAQIINLLMELQKKFSLSLLFISHDLSVVRQISHRILVLYLGKMLEIAPSDEIYERPLHPYTKALISAVPLPDPKKERAKKRIVLEGELPSPLSPPSGCVFRTRCSWADEKCSTDIPGLNEVSNQHRVACHYTESINKL